MLKVLAFVQAAAEVEEAGGEEGEGVAVENE